MNRLFIAGWGPTADEVFYFVNKYSIFDVAGFIQPEEEIKDRSYYDLPVYTMKEAEDVIIKDDDYVFAAMFWDHLNDIRKNLYENLKEKGYKIATLVSPSADTNKAEIGENCWIQDNVYIKPFAKIGNNTYLDTGSFVGLASQIGNHCYLAGKSLVAGYCTVGDQSFIGLNATVFDHTNVGNLCIVGAAMGVKRDVPDCSVVKSGADNIIVKTYEKKLMTEKLVAAKNVR